MFIFLEATYSIISSAYRFGPWDKRKPCITFA